MIDGIPGAAAGSRVTRLIERSGIEGRVRETRIFNSAGVGLKRVTRWAEMVILAREGAQRAV